MRALVHPPSRALNQCELTFVGRTEIDCDLAAQQHAAYCGMLRECGVEVVKLTGNEHLPDCTFVEDTAIVLGDVVVIGSMGATSRREELPIIEAYFARHLQTVSVAPPATIEGGDVLQVGCTLLVGRSRRTNDEGIAALTTVAKPLGWEVRVVRVDECLHLKTACTALGDHTLLVKREWLNTDDLAGFELVDAPEEEPWSANVLRIGNTLCMPAAHRRTFARLTELGYEIHTADISELAKAEAGVTCLSILYE